MVAQPGNQRGPTATVAVDSSSLNSTPRGSRRGERETSDFDATLLAKTGWEKLRRSTAKRLKNCQAIASQNDLRIDRTLTIDPAYLNNLIHSIGARADRAA
jgi:hypothetical protein